MSDWSDHARALTEAKQRLAAAHAVLEMQVSAARFAGVPWSVIGAAVGTSKQAAQQHYGRKPS